MNYDNPCKADMEDVFHRWYVLLHLTFEEESKVAIVKIINSRHNRMKSDRYQRSIGWNGAYPLRKKKTEQATNLDDRVAHVDFKLVKSICFPWLQKRQHEYFRVSSLQTQIAAVCGTQKLPWNSHEARGGERDGQIDLSTQSSMGVGGCHGR